MPVGVGIFVMDSVGPSVSLFVDYRLQTWSVLIVHSLGCSLSFGSFESLSLVCCGLQVMSQLLCVPLPPRVHESMYDD